MVWMSARESGFGIDGVEAEIGLDQDILKIVERGAVIGGLAGTAADRALTTQGGMEYVVQLDGGQAVTLVQGPDTQIPVGQRVLVLYGERARIVPDQSAGAGYW